MPTVGTSTTEFPERSVPDAEEIGLSSIGQAPADRIYRLVGQSGEVTQGQGQRQTAAGAQRVVVSGQAHLALGGLVGVMAGAQTSPSKHDAAQPADRYGSPALVFEANYGQTDAQVDFIARTDYSTVFLTPTAAVFAVAQPTRVDPRATHPFAERDTLAPRADYAGVAVHMEVVGANPNARPSGTNPLSGIVNYFIGNDSNNWHTNIPTFGGARYEDVYPGIDLAYYGNDGQLEYDFIVSAGANPNAISLSFTGADSVEVSPQGDLVVSTAAGNFVQRRPFTFQEVGGERHEVPSAFAVAGTQVRFEVGNYDSTWPLVIDPLVMGYSTYLGGALGDDQGTGIGVDASGNAYAAGMTTSVKFPSTPGAFDASYNGASDVFVTKTPATGNSLLYASYLGGSGDDYTYDLALDSFGNVLVPGYTSSADFPTTVGAFDTTSNGGSDGFVIKLGPEGNELFYSTFFGGSGNELTHDIAVDGLGNAFVTGATPGQGFPTTAGAFDTTPNGGSDAFVVKLSVDGSTLLYGTYLGGSATDVGSGMAVSGRGSAFLIGYTFSADFPVTPGAFQASYNGNSTIAFVARLNRAGSMLAYSTFFGDPEPATGGTTGVAIALHAGNNACIVGYTHSPNLPVTPGAYDTTYNGDDDAFIAKLTGDGSALVYSTYIGGANFEEGREIAVDNVGNVFMPGWTASNNFPTTPDGFDTAYNGGGSDAFLVKLSPDGANLTYGTYLGGSNDDRANEIAVDLSGSAYVTGETASTNFPVTPGAFKRRNRGGTDAFVVKFGDV
jgi:hypothetical protein